MAKKIIVSLPDELLRDVDTYCKEFIYTRSELIRRALRIILYTEKEQTDESLHKST